MKDDVGIGDAAVLDGRSRCIRQLAAEAAEQRAAGVVFGLPFRGADPAVAVTGAAVFKMEGVQHAVADEPVRSRRLKLRIRAVAVKRAIEFAGQFPHDFKKRRVAFHRNRRQIGPGRYGRHFLLHRFLPLIYLYIVKIRINSGAMFVKRNLYSVKIVIYKGPKWPENPKPSAAAPKTSANRPKPGPRVPVGDGRRPGLPNWTATPLTIMEGCVMHCWKRPSGCSSATGWLD